MKKKQLNTCVKHLMCVLAMINSTYTLAETTRANDSVLSLGTTTVTAERIEKTLLESSTSIQLYDESLLESSPEISSVNQAIAKTTNVTSVTGTGKAPTVRGVDGTGPAENANAFFAGSRNRLSLEIDNVPSSYNEVAFGDVALFDAEQVEILRGAQSSLVGRNAIAGSVVVKTKDPKFIQEGKIKLLGGNLGKKQVSGMINFPLNNKAAIRIAGNWLTKESDINYDSYKGVDNPKEKQTITLRGKLLYKPDNSQRMLFTVSHNAHKAPNSEIIVRPFADKRSNFPKQPQHETIATSIGANYRNQLSNNLILSFDGSYKDFEMIRRTAPQNSNATIEAQRVQLEPKIHYDTNNGLKTVAGLYFHHNNQDEAIEFFGGQKFTDNSDTFAIFAEGIIPITKHLELTLGSRFEREKRERDGGDKSRKRVNISIDKTYQAFLPKFGLNWSPTENSNWGISVSKGYNAGGGGISFGLPIVNYEYDKETAWTYELFGRQMFAENRVSTTQNIFLTKYKNMQLPFDLTPETTRDEAFVIRNADEVTTYGAEFGITAQLNNAVSTWGNLGLLKTNVDNYPNSGIQGNELFNAPNVSAALGLNYEHNNINAGISTKYTGAYYSDINNRDGGKTKAFMLTDMNLGYHFDNLKLFSSVTNVFNVSKPIARYPGVTPPKATGPDSNYDSAVYTQPTEFNLGLVYEF